jgi:hypothetical protein
MTFTLRNPISENPHLRSEAAVVSRHASARSAYRALLRLQVVAEREGFHCEAYVWNEEQDCLVPPAEIARHFETGHAPGP